MVKGKSRKSTITVIDIYHSKINNLISISNDSAYNLLDYYAKLHRYQTRISWIYLAKHLSTPKYSLYNDLCCNAKPRSSILIILLLFISGDTGAAINPGPRIDCSYCDKIIRYNSNYLTCQNCNLKVHLKCNNFLKVSDFICNVCTNDYLPFANCDNLFIVKGRV